MELDKTLRDFFRSTAVLLVWVILIKGNFILSRSNDVVQTLVNIFAWAIILFAAKFVLEKLMAKFVKGKNLWFQAGFYFAVILLFAAILTFQLLAG